jgi:alkanesulfonate monooxygenase SsuD/methylene tetrahydromethanopterin reductase-like flavin-dependent oxidoreductase (luciferase family)
VQIITPLPNIGIALRCQGQVSSIINLAQYTEKSNFDSVWLVEVFETDMIGLAAALSKVTQKIKIATGVVNSTLRLPTLLAMGAVTVSQLSNGRFTLGVGAGDPPMSYTTPNQEDKPLVRLKETLQIVRQCLLEGNVNFEGQLYQVHDFQLGVKPIGQIPIFGAAMGMKMVETVAQVADGVLLMMATHDHLKEVKKTIQSITGRLSLKKEPSIACHIITAVSESSESAEKIAKKTVASYIRIPVYRNSIIRMGFSDEIRRFESVTKEKGIDAWDEIPTMMVSRLIVYGTPKECVEQIKQFVSEGVSQPIIYPCMTDQGYPDNVEETIRLIAPLIG